MATAATATTALADWQSILVYCCLFLSASLSLTGSAAIIVVARRKLKSTRCNNPVYQRLMILLSAIDILSAFTFIISPWLLPPSVGYPMAMGTDLTCTISGVFVVVAGLAPSLACCFLSLYFLVTTKYGWREQDASRYLEKPAHALLALNLLVFISLSLALDLLHPVPSAQLCSLTTGSTTSEVVIWLYTATAFVFAGTGLVATYLVYRHVFLVTYKSRTRDPYSIATATANDPRQKRVKLVAIQAVLYMAALMNTLLWPTIYLMLLSYTNIAAEANKWYWYTLGLLGFILYPLQGFFNFFIYINSRLKGWRRSIPELSWTRAAWYAVAKPMDPPRSTSTCSTATVSASVKRSIKNRVSPPASVVALFNRLAQERYYNRDSIFSPAGEKKVAVKNTPEESKEGEQLYPPELEDTYNDLTYTHHDSDFLVVAAMDAVSDDGDNGPGSKRQSNQEASSEIDLESCFKSISALQRDMLEASDHMEEQERQSCQASSEIDSESPSMGVKSISQLQREMLETSDHMEEQKRLSYQEASNEIDSESPSMSVKSISQLQRDMLNTSEQMEVSEPDALDALQDSFFKDEGLPP